MHIIMAFTAMTGDLTAADASDRQISGVQDWEEYVRCALHHAASADASPECTQVWFGGAHLHRTWRTSSFAILRALDAQSREAQARRAEAEAAAAGHDPGTAEADAARALISGLLDWEAAARDAHEFGRRVIANEDLRARPVHDAIAQAGLSEVPGDKRYAAEHRARRGRPA